jgi:primary-amine oxidase
MASPLPHPFRELTETEILVAREVIVSHIGTSDAIFFRSIHLLEPLKHELLPFLQAEHDGALTAETPRPSRLAFVEYDRIKPDKVEFTQARVDIREKTLVSNEVTKPTAQPAFTV